MLSPRDANTRAAIFVAAGLRDKGEARLEAVRPFEVVESGDGVSLGTRKPRAWMARITPIVAILLPGTIAVGGSGNDKRAHVAAAAPSVVALPVTR